MQRLLDSLDTNRQTNLDTQTSKVFASIDCFFFQGFITMLTFRSILAEVDPKLTEEDLDQIISEIDEDGSGTMDFEEFCELMMASPEDN